MHFEIIDYYLNVFFVQLQLKEQNLKSVIWAPEIGLSKESEYVPAHIRKLTFSNIDLLSIAC